MKSLASSLNETERARLFARCLSFEGAEAIHVESPMVFHVRMRHISCDTWGVKAIAVDLLTPGLHRPRQSPFEIGASWETFSYSADFWQARYVPWQLFFDPGVVRLCIELGAGANQKGSAINWDDAVMIFAKYHRKHAFR
jgi:hypothetical protein